MCIRDRIDGWLMEGRLWFDAFVLGAKANGVCAIVLSSKKQTTPSITVGSGNVTIASANAAKILYTLDGTDPRDVYKRQGKGHPA